MTAVREIRAFLKPLLFLVLALTLPVSLKAQQNPSARLDSISGYYLPLIASEKADTVKARLLIRYANSIVWYNLDSSMALANKALELSKKANYNRGIAISLMAISVFHTNVGNYDKGLLYNLDALSYARKITPANYGLIAKIYMNIGVIHSDLGDYNEAATHFYTSIDYAEKGNSKSSLATAYNNLVPVLVPLKEYDKALKYIKAAKELAATDANAAVRLPYLYVNEASILFDVGRQGDAINSLNEAIGLAQQADLVDVLIEAFLLRGNIYERYADNTAALTSYEKAYELGSKFPVGRLRACLDLGKFYLNTHRYNLAEGYLLEGLQSSQDIGKKEEKIELNSNLAKVYFATNRYKQGSDLLDTATKQKDSLISLKKMRSVNLMDIKYQTAKKDKEIIEKKLLIAQQSAKLVKQSIWIAAIIITAIILIAASILYSIHKQRLLEQKEAVTAWQSMVAGEERERTRLARELHDGIGGLLSTLRMYLGSIGQNSYAPADTDNFTHALELLDSTLDEVRNTAHNLLPELLLRHGIPEAIRLFCLNVQQAKAINIDFQYYGFIDRYDSNFELVVYRIAQELIQNIIKHAEASFAIIQLSQHNDLLDLTVEDNGKGISETTLSNGIGLKSIRERVKNLNGSMNITSVKGKGTTIYIEFNLQNQRMFHYEHQSNNS